MKKKRNVLVHNIISGISLIIFIICLIGVVYYSYQIIKWKNSVDDNKKVLDKVEQNIKKKDDKEVIDFKKLKEINADTVAYIKVNGTNIDYVVVRGKDNSYYLNHNFEKKYNIAGWIFADYKNKLDGTDKNLVIFGHNMKDGSMFETLKNVLDKTWPEKKENHIVTLITEDKTYKYQVFSTYSINPEIYYINPEFNNNEFSKFINVIKSRTNYDYGVEVNSDDKVLTLSSCIGDGSQRVVLHAKMID